MKKRVLMVATVPSMIGQFNMNNIDILLEMGYQVDVAADFKDTSAWSKEKIENFKEKLNKKNIEFFQIDFSRSPLKIGKHFKSYKETLKLLKDRKYSFIHTHTPIASAIVRMAAHKVGIKVIYTAHGFHFYKGAPLKNWLIFYPIEKFFSRYTDILITINKEDYERAKDNFSAKKVIQIPGAGVDTIKFESCEVNVLEKRKELGIPGDAFVLLSIGELNDNKNQKVIIEAVNKINKPDIFYLLVGRGNKHQEFERLIKSYSLEKNICLLGYRTDIDELCKIGDCFVHPSLREGLGLAPLEAMASGLPMISSYVGGIKDYTQNGKTGYCLIDPLNVDDMVNAIQSMYKDKRFRKKCSIYNQKKAKEYDISKTNEIMKWVYKEML